MSLTGVGKCPVDHTNRSKAPSPSPSETCPVDPSTRSAWSRFFSSETKASPEPVSSASSSAEICPVDHEKLILQNTKEPVSPSWTSFFSSPGSSPEASASAPSGPRSLSAEREISSIPKYSSSSSEVEANWVYPSEAQFFAAMARKNHNPRAADMHTIVPIHNAVNERAWGELMRWERGRGGERCGGVKLVTFKGRPGERSLRARWKTLLGYSPPFDRHDWIVDRCGTRMRYIIDFYSGHTTSSSSGGNLSFYLDVRPALDSWEAVRMRTEMFWGRWLGFGAPETR